MRKRFASRYSEEEEHVKNYDIEKNAYNEEEEQDMDDIANEAMDSEDEDQDDATTADPSDVNAEAPDDDYEAGTETSHMDEPMDEPIDEDDMSETGGSGNLVENFSGYDWL